MSSIYILEPPTSGKVLLKTTVGDIDIELWAKETPKTCRNFIQLCLEGYYNNTIFHRVVPGFIVQGGDPQGDGTGGASIYGAPFKDEFHQRLRFARRGLLAMANSDRDDNASQFFFTLAATPELQNKHTIFGKITGETVFNMLKLADGLIKDERPVYPHRIVKAEVLHNPFSDIEPRISSRSSKNDAVDEMEDGDGKRKKKNKQAAGVKNFKLLSFGTEAEEDEEVSTRENEKFVGKKSTHDVLVDDPKLSAKTDDDSELVENNSSGTDELLVADNHEQQLENIKKKLRKVESKKTSSDLKDLNVLEEVSDIYQSHLDEEKMNERKRKFDEIQSEIKNVKKEYHQNKLKKSTIDSVNDNKGIIGVDEQSDNYSEMFKEYKLDYDKYKDKKNALPKKGAGREQFTLQLLEKFKKKLHGAQEKVIDNNKDVEEDDDEEEKAVTTTSVIVEKQQQKKNDDDQDEEEEEEGKWLSHKLHFQTDDPILAKDANKKDDDWFEIYDPRSSLNKRRRGENSTKYKK